MKLLKFSFLILLIFWAGCSTNRQFSELNQNAYTAFQAQNYETALALYEEYILHHGNNPMVIPDSIYRGAGLSAFYLDQTGKSLDYLNTIRHSETADAPVQYALAISNRAIDNLSREITALEAYVEGFPEGDNIEEMRIRLFEAWVVSQNYESALALWPHIEAKATHNEELLIASFKANEALDNEQKLDEISRQLLALNSKNTYALFHQGKKHFWLAENRYQTEMKAYENNRTNRQYAQLLRAFEVLNADFRTALNYFLTLYEVDPKPEYARYLGNIYTRFEDRAKARYYFNKAE